MSTPEERSEERHGFAGALRASGGLGGHVGAPHTGRPTPVAIVTGAARGLGRATATALGRKGFNVALVDLRERELKEAAAAVRAAGGEALALRGDVSDFLATQRLAHAVLSVWGRVDVLVNNAGISQPKGLLEVLSEGEVARRRDLEDKRDLYLRRGAREYWITDLTARTLLRLTRSADAS